MRPKSDTISPKAFRIKLMQWHDRENDRQMPWKGEKDPYKIWLSEIILQQTRVEQGLAYFKNFVRAFPRIQDLAAAPDEQVFKLWEGLGYYSRCRNLLHTARYISNELKGHFPDTYESIRALKGVGPYTAAAIASFGFGLPHAVVDGNVYRVLARVFGNATPTDSTAGKKLFSELADQLIDPARPGHYNQAIMDFGAVICKPAAPLCNSCIFKKECVAFRQNKISLLPVKQKKNKVRKRWFYFLVLEHQGRTAIRKRSGKDIWRDLHEFPLIESDRPLDETEVIRQARKLKWLPAGAQVEKTSTFSQLLTHQQLSGVFLDISLAVKPKLPADYSWVPLRQLQRYAFPRSVNSYLLGRKKQPGIEPSRKSA